jgi:hypothetical protein
MVPARRVRGHSSAVLPAARVAVLGLAVVVSGCASSQQTAQAPPAGVGGAPRVARVEIEDDGLPAQMAPRQRSDMPDDPSEPWSPNYGSRAPATPAAPPASTPARPSRTAEAAAPIHTPARPLRMSALEEDAIIRRAIAEHEMRHNAD